MTDPADILRHYGENDLRDRLAAALRSAGLGEGLLSPAELAPLDQFHTRGLAATEELAEVLDLQPGALVLDVGSGLGGPSRTLAATFGCRVQGIDLSPAFVAAATYLAERAGLAGQVAYECADALALPYEAGRFDVAWTQHVAMNIADRDRLYGEVYRVLRPGGRFAIYDVVAGAEAPPHFPVPWATGPEMSSLVTADAMRAVLKRQGFRILSWEDRSQAGIDWFAAQRVRASDAGPPTLGLHVAMGPGFPVMSANLSRNLREARLGLIQAVLARP